MQTHLSIGRNHRFELHEALLIYRDRQSSFITRHDVIASKTRRPPSAARTAHRSIHRVSDAIPQRSVQAEVLPNEHSGQGGRMIVLVDFQRGVARCSTRIPKARLRS